MSKKVTVYSTPTCPYCIKVKQFLKENNVVFEEIDVSADPAKVEEMINKTGQMGVPVVLIDDEAIVGFDPQAISSALDI
ncbi:MAG: glutaredoxin family protein [Candidatus Omnitrophota bacterium]